VMCGLAPNAPVLVLARALQGVGAALLTPGSLAILQASFVAEDRSRAIGAWSGLGGIAAAIGPLLGGWLITLGSWRLVFFINVPVTLMVAVAARHVPESRDPQAGRVDVAGAALITLALVALSYGLIEGPGQDWSSPAVLAGLIVGGVAAVSFVVVERRVAAPMLPLSLFRSRLFSATNALTFVVYAALGGILFLLPVVLQQGVGYPPLLAGAALLPVTIIMLVLSSRSGALAARIGPRPQLTVGPLVIAVGLALLARLDESGSYLSQLLPGVCVFGVGLATTVAPLTSTVLQAAPAQHAGIASAVNNAVARTAGLVAVAALPSLAGITGATIHEPAALLHGFHAAALISAGCCAAGGLLSFLTIRNPSKPASRVAPEFAREMHCGVDAPPLRGDHHCKPQPLGT